MNRWNGLRRLRGVVVTTARMGLLGCGVLACLCLLGCQASPDGGDPGRAGADVAGGSAAAPESARGSAVAVGSVAAGSVATAERLPGGHDLSVISIVSGMGCELLLTDADGRRTGKDPAREGALEEIPRSNYYSERIEDPEGEAGFETRHLDVRGPASGAYRLTIRAVGAADGDVWVGLYDVAGETRTVVIDTVLSAPGGTRRYALAFDRESVSRCTLNPADEPPGR